MDRFPYVSSSAKPSLSKPRLVKQRKSSNSHGKPSTLAQELGSNSDFNPFRPEKIKGKIDTVRVSESPNENVNVNVFVVGGTSFDEGAFVFGAGEPNLSRNSSSRSAASFDSVKSEAGQFIAGSSSRSKPIDIGSTFVFGSGAEKNGDLGDDNSMYSMNVKSSGNADDFEKNKQAENMLNFWGDKIGSGSSSSSNQRSAEFVTVSGSKPQNIETEKPNMGNTDADNFVFGTGVKKSVNLRPNSPVDSDEGLFSKLSHETSKMNLSGVNDFQKPNEFDNKDANKIPEDTEKSNVGRERTTQSMETEGVFVFGSSKDEKKISEPNENLFTGTYQNMAFTKKKGAAKDTMTKNEKTGKSTQWAPIYQSFPMQFVPQESGPHTNAEVDSSGGFSPMDCSPYHDENLVSRDEREEGDDGSEYNAKRSSNAQPVFVNEQTSKFSNSDDASTSPIDTEIERPASEAGTEFTFSSSLKHVGESNITFAASPFGRDPLAAAKHNSRRKNRLKSGQNPSVSNPNAKSPLASTFLDFIPRISNSGPVDSVAEQRSTSVVHRSGYEIKTGKSIDPEAKQEPSSSADGSVDADEACEKWRLRGNQAYANGQLTKAEDCYTNGVNSISLKEIPTSCIRPLSLCYSNRAATRMALGKIRGALNDCLMAVSVDPTLLKARVRVAKCHLVLGEIGEALKNFKKCLQSDTDISSDEKYLIEASDGLQKAQLVADLTGQSAELLLRRTSNDALRALTIISEALLISTHSESLLEMKAEALLRMRKYEEVIKLCEQTLDLAEQNSGISQADSQSKNVDSSEYMKTSSARLWRWRLIAKSYFHLGKLKEALELLQKHEKLKPVVDMSSESSTTFSATVRELLRLKSAGNEAFKAAKHLEAVEHYSAALSLNAESRPYTAVLFCNRAAAYQALGQITDAIADCSLAIALDASYSKAISRRATLHEMIRDYGKAAKDLNRSISLLEEQLEERNNQSRVGKSTVNVTDLKRARTQLATVEEEAQKGISLNMYMILGIEPSSSAADIKKAYRKAALRHHPDKAGQLLVRNENVDGLWREVASEVNADADWLFKMIGEAYTTLSDPKKRLHYDAEEEMRTCPVKSTTKASSDDHRSSNYEKSFSRAKWRARESSYQRR